MECSYNSVQLAKFTEILEQQGVTTRVFQCVLESGVIGDIFHPTADCSDRIAICRAIRVNPEERGMLFFELNYPVSVRELLRAAGCPGWNDEEYIDYYTIPPSRSFLNVNAPACRKYFEANIFQFPQNISRRNARRRMLKRGWSPGGHEHLLALLAKYPSGAKPVDPIDGQKLIALARPATIASATWGRSMDEFMCENALCDPSEPEPLRYLGVRELNYWPP